MSRNSIESARAEANAHRDGLAHALSAMFSSRLPDQLGRAATGQIADTARVMAGKGLDGIRSNPASLVLIGAGLAMLALPSRNKTPEPVPSAAAPLTGEADKRIEAAEERRLQEARIRADRVDIGPGRAQALRVKLDEGLGKLGPDARARVRAARLKAIDAQDKLERQGAKLVQSAQDTHQQQPLMTMLAAVGIGAVIGALLPSTRRETELMGARRDQLLRDAEALLREEISTLESQGKSAVNAGMTAVREELATKLGQKGSAPALNG